jgi:2-keto-3-deoxy-L-fuconate dehydrogenase
MSNLNQKVALITGAGQGIGRASALKFSAAGAKIIACDINQNSLESLATEIDCETVNLDVRDAEAIQQLAQNTK